MPAGGDEPDPAINPKFAHKLAFLDELRDCPHMLPARGQRSIVVGDLNVAPLEHDVWSHKAMLKIVSHTPIECEKLIAAQKAGNWIDVARTSCPSRRSSTRGGATARRTGSPPTRAAGSTTSGSRRRSATGSPPIEVTKDARGWERPSDHVPVTVDAGRF